MQARFAATFGILFVLSALWVPYLWTTTALVEEWEIYSNIDSHRYLLDYVSQAFTTRPLLILPYLIGYVLTPNSFLGLSWLLFALLLLKGVLVYSIVSHLLRGNRVFAFLAAILFILYPADTETFAMRSIAIHVSIVFFLLAQYLLIRYWKRPQRLTLFAMWLVSVLGVLTYEGIYVLFLISPLTLWWMEGRISKRVFKVALLWYAPFVFTGIWAVVRTIQVGETYITQLAASSNGMSLKDNITSIWNNLLRAYARHFTTGWSDALTATRANPNLLSVGVLILAVLGAAWTQTFGNNSRLMSVRRHLIFGIFGVALVAIGFAPALAVETHRTINARVFYFSVLGGALAVVTVLSLITLLIRNNHLRTWIFIGMTSMVILVAAGNASEELNILQDISNVQQSLFLNILRQAPHIAPNSIIVVFDPDEVFRHDYRVVGNSVELEFALNYIYSNNVGETAFFCYTDVMPEGPDESCTLTDNGIEWFMGGQLQDTYPYNKVIAFSYQQGTALLLDKIPQQFLSGSSTVSGYDPQALIDKEAPLPVRALTLFSWKQQISPPVQESSFALDFDDKWLSDIHMVGWREPETMLDGTTFRWSTEPDTRLLVPLVPGRDYTIRFRILNFLSNLPKDSFQLQIGDTILPTKIEQDADGSFIYSANVPSHLVNNAPPYTGFVFHSELDTVPNTNVKLSAQYDWLRIEPSTQ